MVTYRCGTIRLIAIAKMYSKIALIPLVLLIVLADKPATAQGTATKGTVFRGRIVANQIGGQPLGRVTVSGIGANQTESNDGDGAFSLTFPGKEPGDWIQIMVSKKDYVVVNDYLLHVVLPKDPDVEPLVILMSKENERDEWAQLFYRIKNKNASAQTYEKNRKELESAQAGPADFAQLRAELEQANAIADRAAQELAGINRKDSSERYARALSLFLNGEVPDALKLLDSEKLRQSALSAKEQKEEADKAVAEAVQSYLLRARVLTTQFQFDEAEKTYKTAIEYLPDSLDLHFSLAGFYFDINKYDEARLEMWKSVAMARSSGNTRVLGMALSNLGVIDRRGRLLKEAREELEEALKVFRLPDHPDPNLYSGFIGSTLVSLGNVDLDLDPDRTDVARKEYEEGLAIFRQLNQQIPGSYLPDLAFALNNLGNLDSKEGRLCDAREAVQESLRLHREVALGNRETFSPGVGDTLNSLGSVDWAQNRIPEARKHFDEAFDIFRHLADEAPRRFSPQLAATLENLGDLDMDQGQLDEARGRLEGALKIRLQLRSQNQRAYSPDLARTFYDVAMLDWRQGRIDEARDRFFGALQIYEFLRLEDESKHRFIIEAEAVKTLLAFIIGGEPAPPNPPKKLNGDEKCPFEKTHDDPQSREEKHRQ